MAALTLTPNYVPGMYRGRQHNTVEKTGSCIKAWEKKRLEAKSKTGLENQVPPTICFSRQIGVGAMEIADILAKKIEYRVADRLIVEEMAGNAAVKEETITFFDERYAGPMTEFATLLFGEKSFIMSDYMRALTSVIYALAISEPTILVGRAAHLLLPRKRVLAVRFIGSKHSRARRIAAIMDIDQEMAQKKIGELDREQGEFLKRLTGKKEPSPEEFDLVINCETITPDGAAKIVAEAFRCKFKG